MQKSKAISGNVVVLKRRARQRVDGAVEVFMLRVADFLACEVFNRSDEARWSDSSRGGTVTGQVRAGNRRI